MSKLNFRRVCGLVLTIFVAGSLTVSCYDDSELRHSIDELKDQLSQLKTLVSNLQNDDAVTGVTQNADGSYTINFKKSGAMTIRSGKDGEPGTPGKDGSIVDVIKGEESYTFVFADGTTVILPRYSELRVLTFEDRDYKGDADCAAFWTSLVDEAQYGGSLLYGDGCSWVDENNTFLAGGVSAYDPATWSGGLSGGGIAISNYGNSLLAGADYLRQLECFAADAAGAVRTGAGNNASDNFAIVYDAGSYNPAKLEMKDGVARVIESAWINNTCYTLNVLINGNDYTPAMAENGFFKIVATGHVGESITGTTEIFLAKGIARLTEWTRWDLSVLGAVDKVVFSMEGSADLYGDWGLNAPAYFAIDDIAVRVYPD